MGLSRNLNLTILVLLAAALMALSPHGGEAAITCDTVYSDLNACLNYVMFGGNVPAGCCSGMKTLVSAAATTADRQTACSCLKSIVSKANASEISRAAGLPAQCGVNIPFKIGPNTDCSKVKFGF
ncbi:PREDICTED: non-specific lipid-transfer protein 1-like [Ipomoea nil]|uniref:non-specific lipid-transfer protein 1-like n=1 Tax=Ipomoea nil TaxID=35883 RepID=UPI000900A9B0|nr:PREDICTED: non-specific lipid-transfer protein 1-like [Ipomoea nil]